MLAYSTRDFGVSDSRGRCINVAMENFERASSKYIELGVTQQTKHPFE
jgi:hypothetical protein